MYVASVTLNYQLIQNSLEFEIFFFSNHQGSLKMVFLNVETGNNQAA
jgi:hypothetical protein